MAMSLNFDPPIHPGEILREQFLEPLGLSSGQLAKALGVPRTRIERIVREEMGISPDTALRLSRYFDTTPNLWLNLQTDYDLAVGGAALADALNAIRPRQSDNDNTPEKRFKA
jgi:addiction module HigA family antidote